MKLACIYSHHVETSTHNPYKRQFWISRKRIILLLTTELCISSTIFKFSTLTLEHLSMYWSSYSEQLQRFRFTQFSSYGGAISNFNILYIERYSSYCQHSITNICTSWHQYMHLLEHSFMLVLLKKKIVVWLNCLDTFLQFSVRFRATTSGFRYHNVVTCVSFN